MSTDLDRALSDFVDAWNAGRRPRVQEYLQRVSPGRRDELAEQIEAFLEIAPTPAYDDAARAAIRAEPALTAAYAAIGEPVTPASLPTLRERAGLGVRDLAARVTAAVGLRGEEARAAQYLERLEVGDLDPRRLSRRLLDALGSALGIDGEELSRGLTARAGGAPAAAGATFFRAEPGSADAMAAEIDALSRAATSPAPPPMDELDRLFCGGPEA